MNESSKAKSKFFEAIGFIFDSIKVIASLAVILVISVLGIAIYRTASVML